MIGKFNGFKKLATVSASISLGALATLGAFTAGASAQTTSSQGEQQSPVANPRGIVANFDPANLGPILSELGIVWQVQQSSNGGTHIMANVGGELTMYLVPTACLNNGANCIGLNTMALFTGAANPQTVSAFNQKYWFASTGVLSDSSGAFISHYDLADYGIARGNIASSISNFVYLALTFRETLATSGRTVSLDGYADDMAARFLNQQTAEGLGLASATAAGKAELHTQGFEATPQLVKAYMDDPKAVKNKIDNVVNK